MSRKRQPSALIRRALDEMQELRSEHRSMMMSEYARAEAATNGVMRNDRGKRAHIDPWAFFTHNKAYVKAYASPELIEYFEQHPRLTFAEYERQCVYAPDPDPHFGEEPW